MRDAEAAGADGIEGGVATAGIVGCIATYGVAGIP